MATHYVLRKNNFTLTNSYMGMLCFIFIITWLLLTLLFPKKKKKSIEHLISLQINVRYF